MIIQYTLSVLASLWLLSFFYNLYYFATVKQEEIDKVFLNKTKTFEEAKSDLTLLGNYLKKDFSAQKEKISFYENNALRTRRKYHYYQEYIEPFFIKSYLGIDRSYKRLYKSLDGPVRLFLISFTILSILLALLIALLAVAVILYSSFLIGFVLFIFGLGFLIRFYHLIIKLNYLALFLLVDGVLILLKRERGRLYKNIKILDVLTHGWWNTNKNGVLISGLGASAYSGSGGDDFGGFGGGDFGGGGAGGSW